MATSKSERFMVLQPRSTSDPQRYTKPPPKISSYAVVGIVIGGFLFVAISLALLVVCLARRKHLQDHGGLIREDMRPYSTGGLFSQTFNGDEEEQYVAAEPMKRVKSQYSPLSLNMNNGSPIALPHSDYEDADQKYAHDERDYRQEDRKYEAYNREYSKEEQTYGQHSPKYSPKYSPKSGPGNQGYGYTDRKYETELIPNSPTCGAGGGGGTKRVTWQDQSRSYLSLDPEKYSPAIVAIAEATNGGEPRDSQYSYHIPSRNRWTGLSNTGDADLSTPGLVRSRWSPKSPPQDSPREHPMGSPERPPKSHTRESQTSPLGKGQIVFRKYSSVGPLPQSEQGYRDDYQEEESQQGKYYDRNSGDSGFTGSPIRSHRDEYSSNDRSSPTLGSIDDHEEYGDMSEATRQTSSETFGVSSEAWPGTAPDNDGRSSVDFFRSEGPPGLSNVSAAMAARSPIPEEDDLGHLGFIPPPPPPPQEPDPVAFSARVSRVASSYYHSSPGSQFQSPSSSPALSMSPDGMGPRSADIKALRYAEYVRDISMEPEETVHRWGNERRP